MRVVSWLAVCLTMVMAGPLLAQEDASRHYIGGTPESPSDAWLVMRGAQIYDSWFDIRLKEPPAETHAAYPGDGKQSGASTWRCKECHGWDYKGRDGAYGRGDNYTGIKGVAGAGPWGAAGLMDLLRGDIHGYGDDQLPDADIKALARFLKNGLHDTDRWIEPDTGLARGDSPRGQNYFDTVCATCHGYDGQQRNFGSADEPAFVGDEARHNPWEVLHKIRYGHPGHEMVSLYMLPISTLADILAYAQSLPRGGGDHD